MRILFDQGTPVPSDKNLTQDADGDDVSVDYTKEDDKDFYFVLSNPLGAEFPASVTEITARPAIIDDD